ncbi:hypothetical protein Avbf_15584 [Armadillidium vulgare]|nr:hypothetical protein Avbf_15584 [Armadillidium vulgare]
MEEVLLANKERKMNRQIKSFQEKDERVTTTAFETKLLGCRPGAARDLNNECRTTVMAANIEKTRGTRSCASCPTNSNVSNVTVVVGILFDIKLITLIRILFSELSASNFIPQRNYNNGLAFNIQNMCVPSTSAQNSLVAQGLG